MEQPANPAHALLARAHSPDTAASIFESHIKRRPLLLRPSSPDPTSPKNARTARREARRKADLTARRDKKRASRAGRSSLKPRPQPLSAKAQRALGVYEIPKSQRKWALYTGLHALWCDYIREVLGVTAEGKMVKTLVPDVAGPLIASADLHGAYVTVVRSGCVGRVGARGVVVRDTRHTMEIITRKDKLVVVPKEGSVFEVKVPLVGTVEDDEGDAATEKQIKPLVFELYGDQLRTSAPDRANKKFKLHIAKGV